MPVPDDPKIYHIVHIDRLPSIIEHQCLWSDSEAIQRDLPGTTVGMSNIKKRRLEELTLSCHPQLHVGECVPFYFCSRSVMLYLLYRGNHPDLEYCDGQNPIIHLEANLHEAVTWADQNKKRWAFTKSNAASRYFEDYSDLNQLNTIDWEAVNSTEWRDCKEEKQAEFLVEETFPFDLVTRIGVFYDITRIKAQEALELKKRKPLIEIKRNWYY